MSYAAASLLRGLRYETNRTPDYQQPGLVALAEYVRKANKRGDELDLGDLDAYDERPHKVEDVIEVEGFSQPVPVTVSIKVVPDYDIGIDMSEGKFTDKWEDGAIENPAAWTDHHDGYRERNHREYAYYVNKNYKLDDRYETFHRSGVDKHTARIMARESYETEMRLAAKGEQPYVAVIVTVFWNGREVGESSLWGIGLGQHDALNRAWLIEVVEDAMHEAKREAAKSIQAIAADLEAIR